MKSVRTNSLAIRNVSLNLNCFGIIHTNGIVYIKYDKVSYLPGQECLFAANVPVFTQFVFSVCSEWLVSARKRIPLSSCELSPSVWWRSAPAVLSRL